MSAILLDLIWKVAALLIAMAASLEVFKRLEKKQAPRSDSASRTG